MRNVYIRNTTAISPQKTFECEDFLSEITEKDINAKWLQAIEPNYKELIKDAGIRRRMSRVIKMGVASALKCVECFGCCNLF